MTATLTPKKRAPKKYTTEASILKDIDKAHAKIKKLEAFAQTHLDMEELLRGSDVATPTARKHQEEADMLLGKIKRLRETRLVRLGKTLAMFRTKPLVGDETVVLQYK